MQFEYYSKFDRKPVKKQKQWCNMSKGTRSRYNTSQSILNLVATFQGPFQSHLRLADLSCSNKPYWLPGHKLVILHCQDSDVDCGAGHEYGKNRSCKTEIYASENKILVKTIPRFLADADGFTSMPMRVIRKRDKYFFRCCSCPSSRKSVFLGF